MTNKEAVILLKSILDVVEEDETDDFDEAMRKAIESLEKQIPKKPISLNGHKECPSCGDELVRVCRCLNEECGQLIDWSEYD